MRKNNNMHNKDKHHKIQSNNKLLFVMLVGMCALLSGCGGNAGKILGITKEAPDEFTVLKSNPLTLPPAFELQPPSASAQREATIQSREVARKAVFGRNDDAINMVEKQNSALERGFSMGETQILMHASALESNPEIRSLIDRETSFLAKEDEKITDAILFWKDKSPGVVIDAPREQKRIQKNRGLGLDITEGATPIIEQ